ncbi:MAG: hypothetical protein JXR77_18855 [Lentisphaeria bacterium]|nr:hypothetical protein [Lentisphaeria bacterium]
MTRVATDLLGDDPSAALRRWRAGVGAAELAPLAAQTAEIGRTERDLPHVPRGQLAG